MNEAPLTRALLICAATVIILAGVKIAQPIVVPLLVAFFLAVLASPAVAFLVKFKVPAGVSIILVVALLLGFFYGVGSLVAASTDDFLIRLPDYEYQLQAWLASLQHKLPWLVPAIRHNIQEFKPTNGILSVAGRLFSGLGSVLVAFILIIFTLIFALLETQSAGDKVKVVLNDNNSLLYVKKFSKLVQRYLLVK